MHAQQRRRRGPLPLVLIPVRGVECMEPPRLIEGHFSGLIPVRGVECMLYATVRHGYVYLV